MTRRKDSKPVMSPSGHMTPNPKPDRSEWRRAWFRATVRRLGLAVRRVTSARREQVTPTRDLPTKPTIDNKA